MILIERWLDVISILVLGAGIVGSLYLIRSKTRGPQRLLSEKPALFLEFTGKQMFVRQRRSKLLPSFREANLFDAVEPSATIPLIEKIKQNFGAVKNDCEETIRDSLNTLQQYGERCRGQISAVKKQSAAIRAHLVGASRAHLTGAIRTHLTGAIRTHLTGPIRAHLTVARPKSRSRHGGRFREVLMDLQVSLDFHGYRLVRIAQIQWQRMRTATRRLAQSQTTDKYAGVANAWRQKGISALARYRQDLMAGCWTLQEVARAHVRRLRHHELYNGKKSPPPARVAVETDPLIIGLTSAGTLKLKNRLEDDGASSYAHDMGESRKASQAPTRVSVRYVGSASRGYKESAKTSSAQHMVKR